MSLNMINELLQLTQPYINRPDLIQGPGGNTSVKAKDGSMVIKASGFLFSEISKDRGYSVVNASAISDYFQKVSINDKVDLEKEYLKIVSNAVLKNDTCNPYPKPSMETGFHAVLDKYVVHTHSVWANLLNCNSNRSAFLELLKEKLSFDWIFIPYVNPGFSLSYLITKSINEAKNKPMIFFLENHGVVAHADDMSTVHLLLEATDNAIAEIFNLEKKLYPSTFLIKKENSFIPESEYTNKLFKKYAFTISFFDNVIFPDQSVFINANLNSQLNENKIILNEDGQFIYKTEEREALSIHENITGFLFLYDNIVKNGGEIKTINNKNVDYILNMDMEKYRKSLMNLN